MTAEGVGATGRRGGVPRAEEKSKTGNHHREKQTKQPDGKGKGGERVVTPLQQPESTIFYLQSRTVIITTQTLLFIDSDTSGHTLCDVTKGH